jgi:flagellar hook-associated protein 2
MSTQIATGPLTLTKGGTTTSIAVGTGTLAEVITAINDADAGVSATAVQTSTGLYRLQVAATSSGSASTFTLTDAGSPALDTKMTTLISAADATIKIGSGVGAISITSSTNTFSDVMDGLSFTVSKADSGTPITVSSSVDPTAVSDQVAAIVTNANNLLTSIAANTAWDSASKTGGPLLGNSTVRSLQQSILSIAASVSAPGLSVTSTGQLSFDKAAFATAFTADPTAVAGAFGASSTFTASSGKTASASYVNATAATAAGSYDVSVSAQQEQWLVIPPGTGVVGRLISLTRGGTTVSYGLNDGETAANAVIRHNLANTLTGLGLTATESNGQITFTATTEGPTGAFTATVTPSGSASQVASGSNITGTIDGEDATAVGNILTLPITADSDAKGLSIAVTSSVNVATTLGDIGTITYTPGLAQQLNKLFTQMSDSSTGQLVTAQAEANTQVSNLQDAIDSWTTKLDDYRRNLTLKFTAMESALASLKSQSTALTSFSNASSKTS